MLSFACGANCYLGGRTALLGLTTACFVTKYRSGVYTRCINAALSCAGMCIGYKRYKNCMSLYEAVAMSCTSFLAGALIVCSTVPVLDDIVYTVWGGISVPNGL